MRRGDLACRSPPGGKHRQADCGYLSPLRVAAVGRHSSAGTVRHHGSESRCGPSRVGHAPWEYGSVAGGPGNSYLSSFHTVWLDGRTVARWLTDVMVQFFRFGCPTTGATTRVGAVNE